MSPSSNPSSGTFFKVFDVVDAGFRTWTFPAFGLVFVAIGVLLFVGPRLIRAMGIPLLDPQPTWKQYFRHVFLGFAILWTIVAFGSTYFEHRRHQALAQSNACRTVEGPVEKFVPMPYGGHANESFSIANVRFEYSDFVISDSFNNTSSHGGPIDKDSYIRICYDPLGNRILRLEIRDFRGVPRTTRKSLSSKDPTREKLSVRKIRWKSFPRTRAFSCGSRSPISWRR